LKKAEFEDAVRLRVGLKLHRIAEECACGKDNSANHSRNCHLGGYINQRHDRIREYIHAKASTVYKDTETETMLDPVEEQDLNLGANTNDGARTDIRINSFTRNFQDTHMDVQIINVHETTHQREVSTKAMAKAEASKHRLYLERIQKVENATFVPFIFSTRGAKKNVTSPLQHHHKKSK
jgi:hypothetical protein